MKNENVIEVRNVGVMFERKRSLLKANSSKKFWALKDVSFELKKGEVLGVLGKNGAGKSTLLSLLAGIIAPTKGVIESRTNNVSLLSLQAGFVPFLSGRKNIFLSGMLMGFSKKQMETMVEDIIDFSELADFIDEPVANYSAGMKTRLGFSTAIKIEPDVILIDEVLGVGDADFQKKSSQALKEKLKGDMTAVIVSHNEKTISELCDRSILIKNGTNIDYLTMDTTVNGI